MRVLFVSKSGPVTIDESDAELCSGYTWELDGKGYVRAHVPQSRPPRKVYLHNLLLPCLKGFVIDHVDRNPLNNTRANIRICTQAENCRNKVGKSGKTGYVGVKLDSRNKARPVYRAFIAVGRKRRYVGVFKIAEEAAKARDEKARELHGEFAILNFKEAK